MRRGARNDPRPHLQAQVLQLRHVRHFLQQVLQPLLSGVRDVADHIGAQLADTVLPACGDTREGAGTPSDNAQAAAPPFHPARLTDLQGPASEQGRVQERLVLAGARHRADELRVGR